MSGRATHAAHKLGSVSYLGFGFWEAWSMLCYVDGFFNLETFPALASSEQQTITSILFMLCSLSMAISLIVLACVRPIDRWLHQRWFPGTGSILCAAATTLISLTAGGVLSNVEILYGSCILAGTGNAMLCLSYAPIIGRQAPKRSFLEVCYCMILCCFVFFIAAGAPFPVACALCICCPVLSGILAICGQEKADEEKLLQELSLTAATWRFFLAVFIIAAASWFACGSFLTGAIPNDPSFWTGTGTFIALVVCIVLILLYRDDERPYRVSFLYYPFSILVIILLLIMATQTQAPGIVIVVWASAPQWLLILVFDIIFFYIIYQSKMSPAKIMGIGHAFRTLGVLLGGSLGAVELLSADVSNEEHLALYMTIAFLVVVSIVLIAPEGVLTSVLTPIEDDEADRHSEEREEDEMPPIEHKDATASPSTATPALAGKALWRLRCDALCATYKLTPREREVIGLLSKGHGSEYIAEQLVISLYTARTHVRNIYGKTGVHSREELIQLIKATEVDPTAYDPRG